MAKFKPAPRLPSRPRRSPTQTALLVFCVLSALVSTIIVGYLIVRGPKKTADHDLASAPPDVRHLGMNQGSQIGTTRGLNVQFTDKSDPTRLAGTLTSRTLQPLREQNYAVEDPRIWLFRKDGRAELITAPAGRLVMPDGKNPQAGTLTGGVEYRLFEARPDGARPDPDVDEPTLTGKAPTVTFNLSIGEAQAPAELSVTTREVEFNGRDVRVVWDEVRGELKFAEVRLGGSLVYTPQGQGADDFFESDDNFEEAEPPTPTMPHAAETTAQADFPGAPPPAAGRTEMASPPPPPEPAAPQRPRVTRTHYKLTFVNDLIATHGEKRLDADKLEAWVTLVDGKLPRNAFGAPRPPIRPRQGALGHPAILFPYSSETAYADIMSILLSAAIAAQPERSGTPTRTIEETVAGERVTLTWSGRMLIEPQPARPAEMQGNAVAMRFSAERRGLVKFEDNASGGVGHAATIDYQATRRILTLSSPAANAVKLEMPGSGRMECNRLELWLRKGVGVVPGPGAVVMADDGGNPLAARQIVWTEQADFLFQVSDGMMTGRLDWAAFSGNVRAQSTEALIRGDQLQAWFVPKPDDSTSSYLERVEVVGNFRAEDGERGRIAGERARIEFDSVDPETKPRHVTVSGHVAARRNDLTLQSNSLHVDLGQDDRGELTVTGASASGNVDFVSRGDDLRVRADRMLASPELEVLDLTGQDAVVTRGGSEIRGIAMRFDGRQRAVEVFGEGMFIHRDVEAPADHPPLVEVSWSRQMFYDDQNGQIEALGDAVAVNRPDDLTIDVMSGDRIYAEITPRPNRQGEGLSGLDRRGPTRDVLRVLVVGRSAFVPGAAPAVMQTLREQPGEPGAEREIERLLRIEAPEILADNVTQRLRIDEAGRMLVADFRPADGADAQTPGGPIVAAVDGDPRGSALFEWRNTMTADRRTNIMRMTGGVEMRHIRADTGVATHLLCDELSASAESRSAGDEFSMRTAAFRLNEIVAAGHVFLASGTQQLRADMARYDALAGEVHAAAREGGSVTFFDSNRPTPVNAAAIWWDLIAGRMEIRDPGPIVAPGGLR
ncbi:MAG: hypothetical protein KF866_03860 [Phycisphaeraceae bacterium]|nr:hypothetical protein [Phycisphaeraceae bacterium]